MTALLKQKLNSASVDMKMGMEIRFSYYFLTTWN